MSFDVIYRTDNTELKQYTNDFADAWLAGMQEIPVSTSGSTGQPKQLVLQRAQLEHSAKRTIGYFDLKPGETVVSCLSPSTIGGKMMIVRAAMGGLRLIVVEPSSGPLSTLLPEDKPVFCPMVPLQIQHTLTNNARALEKIRTILLGGAPVSGTIENALSKLGNVKIGFGMTETVSHIAIRNAGNPVYTAMEGVSFAVEQDRLIISDKLLGIDRLVTTDAVNLLDPQHFEWLGRTDFVINSGGIKIHPEQLERLIASFIPTDFFISSRPHDTFGNECILVTESDQMDLEAIQNICKAHFGPYAAPRAIVVTALVRNAGGKINRSATMQQAGIDT